jgi:hypothetical protein
VSRQERLAAVEAIAAMGGGRHLPPEEINRAFEEELDTISSDG